MASDEQGRWVGRTVLGIFAHPDDEAFAAAGTLAMCADGGARVVIACATRGESGHDQRDMGTTKALDVLRTEELASSCRAIGADAPLFLGWRDGELAQMDAATMAQTLVEVFDQVRPDVVVTLGEDGAYGHTDHLALTEPVAMALSGAQYKSVRWLQAVFPRDLFLPLRKSLLRSPVRHLISAKSAGGLGVERSAVDLCVELGPLAQRKLASIAAHRSQLRDADPMSFLWPGLVGRLTQWEWFVVASGPDLPERASDPFVGLP